MRETFQGTKRLKEPNQRAPVLQVYSPPKSVLYSLGLETFTCLSAWESPTFCEEARMAQKSCPKSDAAGRACGRGGKFNPFRAVLGTEMSGCNKAH